MCKLYQYIVDDIHWMNRCACFCSESSKWKQLMVELVRHRWRVAGQRRVSSGFKLWESQNGLVLGLYDQNVFALCLRYS